MKIKLNNKKSLCLSVTPTISINPSITNTPTNQNEFTSFRKRMLNINPPSNNNNKSTRNRNRNYNLNIRYDFISKYKHPKHDVIFTQSLGDLSKVQCISDNNKTYRFKKPIIKNINNTTDINDYSCSNCIKEEPKCELILHKNKAKMKKIKHNSNVHDNTHIHHVTTTTSNDTRSVSRPQQQQQQRKHNYKLSTMLYTKILTPHQMHLISSTRRQTKRILPTIRNVRTSAATKLIKYYNTQIIKDFIYKTFPSQNNAQLPSTTHIVLQNVLSLHNYSLFGVFNAHGKDGYHLSCIAKAHFEYIFTSLSTYFPSSTATPSHYNEVDVYALLSNDNFKVVNDAFMKVNNQLQLSQYEYDKNESYFSLVLLFSIGNNIISASVGVDVTGIRLTHIITKCNKEIINCISLSNTNNTLSLPVSSLSSPLITSTNIITSNTKCIFISSTDLFTKLSQTTICKLLTKAIPYTSTFQPYIITIPTQLHSLYKSSSSSYNELSFILLYY